MKTDRKEAAEIVRRLDDAAIRAKRGRGLDALKDWDTAEFDGFSTRSSSGLEQLRHWDDAPTSQVVPLTPLPLKDVPGIGATSTLAPAKPTSEVSLDASTSKGDLYPAEMPAAAAPLIQPASAPVSPPVVVSQTPSSPQIQPISPAVPATGPSFVDLSIGSSLKAEPPQTGREPSGSRVISPSLKKHLSTGTGALQDSSVPGISPTVKSAPEGSAGSAAPAVRLTGALGVALTRNAAITQPRLSTLSAPGYDRRAKDRAVSAPRPYERSREPKLVTKPQPERPVLKVKPDDAADFTPAQRAGINAGITIGTGLALAAVTVWLLVWFVSQSMSMVMDSLRAFVQ